MQKFLIIEDDEATRFLLKRILTKNFECEVLEAANGAIGLQMLLNSLPDIILLDVSMPVMDGIETLNLIRSYEIYKKIPVIVITAMSDSQVVGTLAQMGITDYLLKPIDNETSVNRIKKMIGDLNKDGDDPNLKLKKHVLIVDGDAEFKTFFDSIMNKRFIIHQASNGVDGLEIYSKHFPRYVFICNNLGLLDKKILTQKIREIAGDKSVSIYLLVNDFKALSTKIFAYDGTIQKNKDKEKLLHDINALVDESPKTIVVLEENENKV